MEETKKTCDCGCEDEACDCCNEAEEIVELEADDGRKLKFYFIGTLDYEDKVYAAFEPAEAIDGVDEESLVIFELKEVEGDEEASELLPIKDEALLENVYNAFCEAMEGEDEDCDCGCEDGECHCHDEN